MRLSRTFATFIPSTYLSNIISGRCSEIQMPLYASNVLYCAFTFVWSLYLNVLTYFLKQKSVFTHVVTDDLCSVWLSQNASADAAVLAFHTQTPSIVLACWSTRPIFKHSNNNLTSILAPHILCLHTNSMELNLLSCLFVSSPANFFAGVLF